MVPNAGWSKRHEEMIRIDDERRAWCLKTKKQGLAGGEAPRPPGHGRRNVRDLVQRERRYKGRRDFVHQVAPPTTPAHPEVYKLPDDNKSVLKGNFFCGIILSPERNQRCNTGNNMKGDAI